MELTGKRIAIFVDNLYQEMELWYPLYRFREAGAETVLIGAKAGQTYTSKTGYPATSDISYQEARAEDFDGLIVPGGFAPDYMRRSAEALQFVRQMNEQGKLIGSICHALWVPASAGILRGRRTTCFFAIKDDVINAGGLYEDAEVVVDGNLVSSRKPDDLPAFCRAAIAVVMKSPVAAR